MKCRERLLNPHRLKLNFSILPIVDVDGEKYRMFSQAIVSIATGSCQCLLWVFVFMFTLRNVT